MPELGLTLKNAPLFTNCMTWSKHGQAAITVSNDIHIVTPSLTEKDCMALTSLTINHLTLNIPSVPRGLVASQPIPMISPASCQDVIGKQTHRGLMLNYSLPESFRCAVWSPLGLSKTFTCLLLVVTTHFRVSLVQAINDPATGEWACAADMSETVTKYYTEKCPDIAVLHVQTISASWSDRVGPQNVSFIALGSESGAVSVWRFDSLDEINPCLWFQACKSRITTTEFSQWIESAHNSSIVQLATSTVDGSVHIHQIQYEHDTKEIILLGSRCVLDPGSGLVTVCRFSPFVDKKSFLLMVGRGRWIHLCTLDQASTSLLLPTWESISSIIWTRDPSYLRIYTTDGKCIAVSIVQSDIDLTLTPTIVQDHSHALLLESFPYVQKVSNDVETMVEHSKASHIENTDINNDDDDMSQFSEDLPMGSLADRLRLQVFGAAHSMYGYQDIVLIICDARISQLYKTDTRSISNAIIWTPPDTFFQNRPIQVTPESIAMLVDPKQFEISTPQCKAWGMIQETIGEGVKMLTLSDSLGFFSIIQYLESTYIMADHPTIDGIESLFNDPGINALRAIVNILSSTSQLWMISPDAESINESLVAKIHTLCGHYIQSFAISTKFLYDQLTDVDIQLARHIFKVAVSFAHDSQAENTVSSTSNTIDIFKLVLGDDVSTDDDLKAGLVEACPACESPIPVDDTAISQPCVNGHAWGRCALTFKLIGTPNIISCLGCKRGQLWLDPEKGPLHAAIHSIEMCIYCGDRFRGPNLALI
ncbi:hypothetical protein QVD99_004721 [Batrachochytrium dendrobatidis]|nr:hypothetical protein O5D80_002956 [Batrachochytrium dendrobatidis]KAK5668947.1 hypothetical protein QVD99_004721 [Batrachochytrium dendrobatidis]